MRHVFVGLLIAAITLSSAPSFAAPSAPSSATTTKVSPAFLMAFGGMTLAASAFAVRLAAFPARHGDVAAGGVTFGASPLWYLPGVGGGLYGLGTVVGGLALPDSTGAVLPGLGMLALGAAELGGVALMAVGSTMKRPSTPDLATPRSTSLKLGSAALTRGAALVVSGTW